MKKNLVKKNLAAIGVAVGIGISALATAPTLAAEKSSLPGSFSANASFTSEYYFRGLSQTDDAPALQGGFDYEVPLGKPVALYLGVWGSNVDFNEGGSVDGATVEIDYYGGFKGNIGDSGVSWDVGFIYYSYPGAASSLNYDFWEAQAALGYDFGVASVSASVNYSPDNFGESGAAFYPKLAVEVPIPGVKGLALSGHVAKQYIDKEGVFGSPDYVEWNLGIGYNVAGFDLAVNYTDTDISPSADANDAMVLFTIARSF